MPPEADRFFLGGVINYISAIGGHLSLHMHNFSIFFYSWVLVGALIRDRESQGYEKISESAPIGDNTVKRCISNVTCVLP